MTTLHKTFSSLFTILFFAAAACSSSLAENRQAKAVLHKDSANVPHGTNAAVQYIYLTFDDGPLDGSEDVDDAVKQEHIKINVFVVGQHALSSAKMRNYYKLYQQNEYIEIGNHSFSHAHDHYQLYYAKPDSVVADFLKCQQLLNIPNKFARQPGRNQWRLKGLVKNDVSSGIKSADKLHALGYSVFGWDVEWSHDSKTGDPIQTVDDMVELITKKLTEKNTVRPGHLVLLSHDEMFRNGWEESELKQLIEKLRSKGNYQFEHLSKYPD